MDHGKAFVDVWARFPVRKRERTAVRDRRDTLGDQFFFRPCSKTSQKRSAMRSGVSAPEACSHRYE